MTQITEICYVNFQWLFQIFQFSIKKFQILRWRIAIYSTDPSSSEYQKRPFPKTSFIVYFHTILELSGYAKSAKIWDCTSDRADTIRAGEVTREWCVMD